MPALGYRTIWIALRAVNYTAVVFSQAVKSVDSLISAQKTLTQANITAAKSAMMAGMMFAVLGASLFQAGIEVARTTQALGPLIRMFDVFMKTAGQSEILKTLAATALMAGGALLFFGGIAWSLLSLQKLLTMFTLLNSTLFVTGVAAMMAFGAFSVAFTVLSQLKNPIVSLATALIGLAIVFWQLYIAATAGWSAVSLGVLGVAGGIAAAGALALATQMMHTQFQMGTRSAGKTGFALVHKHEVVYNPTTNRPTQVGNDLNRGGGETTIFEMPVTIEQINTKADIDDVDDKLSEVWRRKMRRRR